MRLIIERKAVFDGGLLGQGLTQPENQIPVRRIHARVVTQFEAFQMPQTGNGVDVFTDFLRTFSGEIQLRFAQIALLSKELTGIMEGNVRIGLRKENCMGRGETLFCASEIDLSQLRQKFQQLKGRFGLLILKTAEIKRISGLRNGDILRKIDGVAQLHKRMALMPGAQLLITAAAAEVGCEQLLKAVERSEILRCYHSGQGADIVFDRAGAQFHFSGTAAEKEKTEKKDG